MCPKKFKQERKAEIKRRTKMVKLLRESQSHDRNKCNCEGCKLFTILGTIIKDGRLLGLTEDWKSIQPDEWFRTHQRMIQYKIDKKIDKEKLVEELKKKGAPENIAKQIIDKMDEPLFIVMWKAPPQGLLREI